MICRFCDDFIRSHEAKIKYGVRHYAHQDCYLDRRGIEGLKAHQVGRLSFRILRDRGLVDRANEIMAAGQEELKRQMAAREEKRS